MYAYVRSGSGVSLMALHFIYVCIYLFLRWSLTDPGAHQLTRLPGHRVPEIFRSLPPITGTIRCVLPSSAFYVDAEPLIPASTSLTESSPWPQVTVSCPFSKWENCMKKEHKGTYSTAAIEFSKRTALIELWRL